MATTHIISIHVGKGKTAHQSLKERLDYIMNPEKTDGGILISSHACSPETAADEFMLYRQEYLNTTGRKRGDEVLAYHVRQAFKPGEITAEKANEIGKALVKLNCSRKRWKRYVMISYFQSKTRMVII